MRTAPTAGGTSMLAELAGALTFRREWQRCSPEKELREESARGPEEQVR
jgi:hypothetical protein